MSLAQTLPGQKNSQSTLPSARLIVTSQARRHQFLIQWKEVRHRRAAPRTEKNGTVLGQKQSETQRGTRRRGNVGACGGRSEQITKKTSSGWGTSELARAGQQSHLQLANKQTGPPVFLPLLLDRLFSVEEHKHPPRPGEPSRGEILLRSTKKKKVRLIVFSGPSACCFPRRWAETVKSNCE